MTTDPPTHLAANLIVGFRNALSFHWVVTRSQHETYDWAWFRSYELLLGPLSLGIVVFREFETR